MAFAVHGDPSTAVEEKVLLNFSRGILNFARQIRSRHPPARRQANIQTDLWLPSTAQNNRAVDSQNLFTMSKNQDLTEVQTPNGELFAFPSIKPRVKPDQDNVRLSLKAQAGARSEAEEAQIRPKRTGSRM